MDPVGHRTGAEVDDGIGDADRHHLGVGRAAEEVVEPAGNSRLAGRREVPLSRCHGRAGSAGSGARDRWRRSGSPPTKFRPRSARRWSGIVSCAGVVAGVQNADANAAAGRVADPLARGLEPGVIARRGASRSRAYRPASSHRAACRHTAERRRFGRPIGRPFVGELLHEVRFGVRPVHPRTRRRDGLPRTTRWASSHGCSRGPRFACGNNRAARHGLPRWTPSSSETTSLAAPRRAVHSYRRRIMVHASG